MLVLVGHLKDVGTEFPLHPDYEVGTKIFDSLGFKGKNIIVVQL